MTLAIGLLGVSSVSATHYKLFVLTGQSNSLGTTNGGEADPTSGSDPADANVLFYWDNVADASTSLGDSGGVWTTLQDQQGGHYGGSATHWGPEINLARTLYRAGVRDFGVIKASRGGGGNTNWSMSSGGHMYPHVTDTVDAAIAALDPGDTFEIVGFLYLQGESDSGAEANIADTRLSELITNLRGEWPEAASMHAVAGGITIAGANRDIVRAKQAALAAGDVTISYFENLDMQGQLPDGIHLSKAAKMTVGERYAQAFLDAGVCVPDFGKLTFVGDSITQGGLGFPSYRYQVFKHLVDRSATYTFTGSVTGAYAFQDVSGSTPPYGTPVQNFSNVHEGHFGWRAFWENARVALPSGRRSNNRGEGTVLNWTGQATQYDLDSLGNLVDYPDPGASGTGSTGVTYIPDTVVIMIGINDLAGGTAPTQMRDDIATMIDQYRAVNANVRIHINKLLHTNQGAALQTDVDTLNGLLQPLADTKNAAVPTSPVWVIDASTGFEPVTMTHDAVHPNTAGEVYVGDRIAAALGLIETPMPTPAGPKYEGNEIWDSGFLNGWGEVNGGQIAEQLVGDGTNLRYYRTSNASAAWLEGVGTGWGAGASGDWTFEVRIKFNANPEGFVFWSGIGGNRVIVEMMGDRTRDNGANSFDVLHNNLDGQFHVFRIVHDSAGSVYHVWRDEERLSPLAGTGYDLAGSDVRLIMGDYTGGAFGNDFDVEIDYVCADQSGGYLPPGADFDADGMPDIWELEHFGDVVAGVPGNDDDGDDRTNLEEYLADTDPQDASSHHEISSISGSGSVVDVKVENTSPDRFYQLEGSDDLGQVDPWAPIGTGEAGNTGDLILQDVAATVDERFYRVGVSIP